MSLSNQVKFPQIQPVTLADHGGPNQRDSSGKPGLQMAAEWWPTPDTQNARDGTCRRAESEGRHALSLHHAVAMWPTPTKREYKGGRKPETLASKGRSDNNTLADKVQAGAQLNPDWVEWLMGFPLGWTEVDAESAIQPRDPHWWDFEPPIPRVATGIPHRADRLKCLGNAVVPTQFYPIFAAIAEVEGQEEIHHDQTRDFSHRQADLV